MTMVSMKWRIEQKRWTQTDLGHQCWGSNTRIRNTKCLIHECREQYSIELHISCGLAQSIIAAVVNTWWLLVYLHWLKERITRIRSRRRHTSWHMYDVALSGSCWYMEITVEEQTLLSQSTRQPQISSNPKPGIDHQWKCHICIRWSGQKISEAMDDCSIATDWFSCYAKEWNPFLLPVTEQGIIIVQHGHLFPLNGAQRIVWASRNLSSFSNSWTPKQFTGHRPVEKVSMLDDDDDALLCDG